MAKNDKNKQEDIIEEEIITDEDGTVTEEITLVEEEADDNEEMISTEDDSDEVIEQDEEDTIIEDEITVNKDGSVREEVTLVEKTDTKLKDENGPELKNNSSNTKQIAIWIVLIIAVIGAMFGAKYFNDVYVKEKQLNEQINAYVENTQINLADKETNAAIEENDVVIMDFTGYIDNKEFDGGSSKDVRIRIGSNVLMDGFEDQLIGKKKGDKVDVKVTFPENYGNEALNGKDATFKVTIKNVFVLPEANDELAKKYAKYAGEQGDESAKNIKSLEDFKAYLKDYIEKMKAYYAEVEKYQQQQQDAQDGTDSGTTEESGN